MDDETVVEREVVVRGPDVKPILCPNELGGYPHPIVRALHAALQNVRHLERLRNLRDRLVLIAKREARRARGHFEVGDLREHVQDRLGQAIRKVLVVFAA